jgi:4-aminobutyrate aminotransferase-like enzyme
MDLWRTNPLEATAFTRGEGCTVWDSAGKPYLDLLSGTWCCGVGHGHPRLVRAVQEQVARLTHIGAAFVTAEIGEALSKLAEILPAELNRAVFLNTGSEAVDLALKMARAATGANEIVVVERSYYGATSYALALSEAGRAARYLPSAGLVHRLPFACDDLLSELAEKGAGRIAAVLYEPVLGGGILVPPIGYGTRLRELASRCGALLIAEEVTTGMGRTGRWFGFEHDGIVPDVVVMGKGLGGGLPVSAVATTTEVEARCGGALRHVQSHQNDPLSGRIAATVISILQDERLVERAAERGRYLLDRLTELQRRHASIRELRGRGAMVGVELAAERAAAGPGVARRLLEAGFILDFHAATSTFRLFPPFVIAKRQIDEFVEAFERVLSVPLPY